MIAWPVLLPAWLVPARTSARALRFCSAFMSSSGSALAGRLASLSCCGRKYQLVALLVVEGEGGLLLLLRGEGVEEPLRRLHHACAGPSICWAT